MNAQHCKTSLGPERKLTMKYVICLLSLACMLFCQAGCASREKTLAEKHIFEAKAAVAAARLKADDSPAAARTMERAEDYLKQAEAALHGTSEKKKGVFARLKGREARHVRAAVDAIRARKEAEKILEQTAPREDDLEVENALLRSRLEAMQADIERLGKAARKRPGDPPERLYQEAMALFENRRYDRSREAFARFVREHPGHDLQDNAQYWVGECYFAGEDWDRARTAFKTLLVSFEESNKGPDALVMLGLCELRLNNPQQAGEYWRRVVRRHPDARAAAVARNLLNRM